MRYYSTVKVNTGGKITMSNRMPPHPRTKDLLDALAKARDEWAKTRSCAELDERLGVASNYFGRILSGERNLPLDSLFWTLDAIEMEPSVFMARAFGPLELDAEAILRDLAGDEESLLAKRALSAPASDGSPSDEPFEEIWERIEARRTSDPRGAAADLAPLLLRPGCFSTEERLRLLCSQASIDRQLDRVERAAATLASVLALTKEPERWPVRALGLECGCSTLLQAGKPSQALRVSEELLRFQALRLDRAGLTTALATRGAALNHLGRYEEAIHCHKRALASMEEPDPDATVMAAGGVGYALLHMNRAEEAIRWLERALNAHPVPTNLRWYQLRWMLGDAYATQGDLEVAESIYAEVADAFEDLTGPYDRALIALSRADLFLKSGRLKDLRQLLLATSPLIAELPATLPGTAALDALIRTGLMGRATERSIARVRRLIENARERENPLPGSHRGRASRPAR